VTKARLMLVLIAAFAVTLAAGAAAGYAIRSYTHRASRRFPDLKLTAEQKAKMDEIWNAVMRDSRRFQSDQRQALQKQRDEAVRGILTEEQKLKYDGLLKDYAGKRAELDKGREKAFQEAVEKTKLILNAEQRVKYEEWLKNWREDRHPGGAPAESKASPQQPALPVKAEEHTATGSGT
jgi:Spy/CpxP family protein refolding chaperone